MKLKRIEKAFFLCLILFGAVCFLTGCGVSATNTIEGIIPLVSAIVGIVGAAGETVLPTEAGLIATGVTLAENGLNALLNALKTYDANKSAPGALNTLQAIFGAAHDNLNQLLAAAQVKNPITAQRISGVVNAVIGVVSSIEAYVVSKAPAVAAAAPTADPTNPV